MYPVECVVRGYLSGSGWREYRESGAVCGIELPEGLRESDRLPEPIFTPATKADVGDHDENIDFDRAVEIIGSRPLMEELRRDLDRALRARRARTRRARDHPRRHEVRVRLLARRRGRPRRRGADARLVAVLARRRVRAGPRPALVRQAVRPRLARRGGLGPLPAGAEPSRRGDREHARQVPRGLRADHRPQPRGRGTPALHSVPSA